MAGLRVGGLASGMDIDSIVGDLMKAERMPLDKMKQEKQTLEWRRDDYRSMNTLLLDFRSELTQMKLTTNYRVRQTFSTNDSFVTATASSAAGQSSYSIASVTQLASAETRVNGGSIYAEGNTVDTSKALFFQGENFKYPGTHKDSNGNDVSGVWKTGAVVSKTINVTAPSFTADFGKLEDSKVVDAEISSWSVKVNGVGFNAVTETELGESKLKENEVLVKSDGTLQFGKELSKDSVIKIDYVADTRTDTLGIAHNSTSLQLNQGAIDISKEPVFTLTKDGIEEQNYKLKKNGEDYVTDNGEYQIVDENDLLMGTLNAETGKITLTGTGMPKPSENSDTTISLKVTYAHKYTDFSIDTSTSKGERHDSFLITGSESLNSVVSRVNSASIGVSMFFDTFTGKMTMTRTETGDFNSGDEIRTSGSFIDDVLRFKETGVGKPGDEGVAGVVEEGKNAEFTINRLTTERTSNTFEINGVNYNLKKTFGAEGTDDPSASPVTINISNDSTKVFDNIKAFVEKYNELIDKIQKKVGEERYRSYTPLTDLQREQLTDKQQEQWEEKAKSGMLRRDSTLNTLLSDMRMNFYSPVTNDAVSNMFNQLAKIGIKTTSNYLEGGKLEINEAELKKAIEEDPLSVENLFKGDGTTEGQKGIVHRLYDSVNKSMDQLKLKAGNSYSTNQSFTIGRELSSLESQIDRFESRLTQIEDRYWRQFTAMEKAIQQANSQSAYLMQQFSF